MDIKRFILDIDKFSRAFPNHSPVESIGYYPAKKHWVHQEFNTLKTFESAGPLIQRYYDECLQQRTHEDRLFTLWKGTPDNDSRRPEGLRCELKADLEDLGEHFYISLQFI